MRLLDLFSGTGGFSLAAQWVWKEKIEIVAFVEINKQCQRVLRRHWPWNPLFDDIRKVEEIASNVGSVDLITGGDPCPIRSKAASIHKTPKYPDLSGFFLALVGRCWPRWVVRENVPASDDVDFEAGLAILGYRTVIVRMDALAYTGQSRKRDFIIGCHSETKLLEFASAISKGDQGNNQKGNKTKEYVCCLTTQSRRYDTRDGYVWDGRDLRVLDSKERTALSGFPEGWFDGFSETAVARMTGNAVVPQVAEQIFRAIKEIEDSNGSGIGKEDNPMANDEEFKALRHRFYRLGRHGMAILQEMGFLEENPEMDRPNKEDLRSLLFEINNQGRAGELEFLITKMEREILEQIGHRGDPCEFCGVPFDEVKPGPCPVRKGMVKL